LTGSYLSSLTETHNRKLCNRVGNGTLAPTVGAVCCMVGMQNCDVFLPCK